MTITYREDGFSSKYLYHITIGGLPYTAFETHQAFIGWLGLHEMQLITIREEDERAFKHMRTNKTIKDLNFWSLEEVPEGAEPFIGLSNGSYTTCYLVKGDEENAVYRPNPNAKEYKQFNYKEARELINRGLYSTKFLTK